MAKGIRRPSVAARVARRRWLGTTVAERQSMMSALGKRRMALLTRAQRSAHGKMMAAAREQKRRQRARTPLDNQRAVC
jgi:hypothetical protein